MRDDQSTAVAILSPAAISARVEDYAAAVTFQGGVWSISDRRAPAGRDLAALQDREAQLTASLAPGPMHDIQRALLQMFLAFPSSNGLDMQGAVAAYAAALSIFPAWAVTRACEDVVRGRAGGNKAFAPSAAEVSSHVTGILSDAKREAALIRKVLGAQIYREVSDDEKARVSAAFRALADELGMSSWGSEGDKPVKRERSLDELAAHYAANPLQPSETIASMTGKRGA